MIILEPLSTRYVLQKTDIGITTTQPRQRTTALAGSSGKLPSFMGTANGNSDNRRYETRVLWIRSLGQELHTSSPEESWEFLGRCRNEIDDTVLAAPANHFKAPDAVTDDAKSDRIATNLTLDGR